jgi:Rrf2 family protein
MEITRETDYGVRCILYLSGKPDDVVMVDEVAKEMQIPKSFLAKILQKLARAGVVKSFRGVKGGFQLARKPAEISLLDVVEAIEGPVAMNRCALDSTLCAFSGTCSVHPVWVDLRKKVEEYMGKTDFEKLRRRVSSPGK